MKNFYLSQTTEIDGINLTLSFSASSEALLLALQGGSSEDESLNIPSDLSDKLALKAHQEIADSLLSLRPRLIEALMLVSCQCLREEIKELSKE